MKLRTRLIFALFTTSAALVALPTFTTAKDRKHPKGQVAEPHDVQNPSGVGRPGVGTRENGTGNGRASGPIPTMTVSPSPSPMQP